MLDLEGKMLTRLYRPLTIQFSVSLWWKSCLLQGKPYHHKLAEMKVKWLVDIDGQLKSVFWPASSSTQTFRISVVFSDINLNWSQDRTSWMTRTLNVKYQPSSCVTLLQSVNCDPSNDLENMDWQLPDSLDRQGRGDDTVIGDFIYLVILDQIKPLCHFHIYTISYICLPRGTLN